MMVQAPERSEAWWREATGYQIYPASFKDSNGDGIGDLNGITSSLDYLKELGVDFIWISPVYDSPNHDMGYDIRNYEKISAQYGTLEDMDRLITEAKARDLRVIMDLVVNHTSAEHHWFQESRKSKTNPYSNWYIWRDPKYDENGTRHPPTNWRGIFPGSTWTYEPQRDQYYFHLFLPEQPDLNWENHETRRAVYSTAVDFWIRRGIDGFRVDMANAYGKEQSFPDAHIVDSSQPTQPMEIPWFLNNPQVHKWLQEIRREVLDPWREDLVLIAEIPGTAPDEVLRYVSAARHEIDLTLDGMFFVAGNHWSLPLHDLRLHKLPELKEAIAATQGLLKGTDAWTSAFLENHDAPRSVSHFGPGDDTRGPSAAKMLALFNTTLSGTLIVYQGQEIGMTNVPKDSWKIQDFQDKMIHRYFREVAERYPGNAGMQKRAFEAALGRGRDNSRTPMQWSAEGPHGGFSTGTKDLWLRINPNYKTINVHAQLQGEESVLSFWKDSITRRRHLADVLVHGDFEVVDIQNEHLFSFWKVSRNRKAFVVLNFSSEARSQNLPEQVERGSYRLVVSTAVKEQGRFQDLMQPWEGRLYVEQEG